MTDTMERIDRILKHSLFRQCRTQIEEAEKDRIYCRHNLDHSMDVARIAYILNLEEQGMIEKELIYAMALVHDLGRSREYHDGTNHHLAGAEIAEEILSDCGFTEEEIQTVCRAVLAHRSEEASGGSSAEEYCKKLLYRADKLSRDCYDCKASKTCYWKDEIRNHQIKY